MSTPQYRVFFDTSVYIAALISPRGAAGELIRLAEAGIIQMIVSEEVIIESDRVLTSKFPELIQDSRKLWQHLRPEVVVDPPTDQVNLFSKVLSKGDASILCAAHLAKPTIFVTWNTRDFMSDNVTSLVDFPIVIPADGLSHFRKWITPFLS